MSAEIHPLGYFALVLHKTAQDLLLTRFATLPFHVGHHCTVAYGTDRVEDLPAAFGPEALGKEFRLRVKGHALRGDSGIEAVAVELVGDDDTVIADNFSTNRVPHVTIATDGRAKASESNALLEAGYTAIDGPVVGCTLMHVPPQDESLRRHPEICMAGDEILRRVADPLTPEEIGSAAIRDLVKRMRRILGETVGVGLAAPQVGVSKRVICVEVRETRTIMYDRAQFAAMERVPVPFTVLINPVTIDASAEQRVFFENCLSASAYCAAVTRSRHLTVDYLDLNGQKQRLHAMGWLARILQHEMDHLDGVLCLDKMIPRTLVSRISFAARWSREPVEDVLKRFGAGVGAHAQ